jgi:hypothetical protein
MVDSTPPTLVACAMTWTCAERVGGVGVADLEAEHRPEPTRLPGGAGGVWIVGQAGVAHPADRRVRRQPAGELAGRLLGLAQTHGEGAGAAGAEAGCIRLTAGREGRAIADTVMDLAGIVLAPTGRTI